MARTYPIELRLTGRRVVVIGGGGVATRKVAGLLEAGAAVCVVSPEFSPELMRQDRIVRETRPYDASCLAEATLVFACTNDRAVNARVAADAARAGIWCNVADDPEAGDFHVPAILRRGDLTISVATGGAGPHLAAAARDRLASQFDETWGILVAELTQARKNIRERVHDSGVRRDILETLSADCSLTLLATRGPAAWRQWVERLTEHRLKGLQGSPKPL